LTAPGGVQAWKIVIPASQSTPAPRTHDGFEWLYVLAGRMRLILGDQDLVLGTGEAAEFDTRLPHWFGSTGDAAAEVLSIFGRPGERLLVRAHPPGDRDAVHADPHEG
jgi:quercetin dioxygenase-like cupin family protein